MVTSTFSAMSGKFVIRDNRDGKSKFICRVDDPFEAQKIVDRLNKRKMGVGLEEVTVDEAVRDPKVWEQKSKESLKHIMSRVQGVRYQ